MRKNKNRKFVNRRYERKIITQEEFDSIKDKVYRRFPHAFISIIETIRKSVKLDGYWRAEFRVGLLFHRRVYNRNSISRHSMLRFIVLSGASGLLYCTHTHASICLTSTAATLKYHTHLITARPKLNCQVFYSEAKSAILRA